MRKKIKRKPQRKTKRRQPSTTTRQLNLLSRGIEQLDRDVGDRASRKQVDNLFTILRNRIEDVRAEVEHVALLVGQLMSLTCKTDKTGVAAVDHFLDMEHRVRARGIEGLTKEELAMLGVNKANGT